MKKIIKGILIAILAVLPLHSCAGEMLSIQELGGAAQENALLEWNQTYEAYGRTIQVNIPIIIPDVEQFPIIQVSAWMGSDIVDSLGLPEAADQTNAGVGTFYEDANILTYLDESNPSDEKAILYCPDIEKLESAIFQAFYHEPGAARLGNWGYTSDTYYPYEVDSETLFAEDNSLSFADAQDTLKRLLTYYYGEAAADVEMDYIEVRGRARKQLSGRFDDLGDYKPDYPKGTYCLYYRQKIEGIPVYMEISTKMLTTGEGNLTQDVALKPGRIQSYDDSFLEFMDFSSFFLDASLLKEERILEPDVPLASLCEIIGRLETEINEGRLRSVFALRLGYVCYLDENSPETYTLYPAWICDCIYAESPKQEIEIPIFSDAFRDNFCYEQIIIDAQTCELQAGWIAEDEELFHSALITWDGV